MSFRNTFVCPLHTSRARRMLVLVACAAGCAAPAPEPAQDRGGAVAGEPATERIARWTRERPGQPLPASVGFRAVQPDSTVRTLLARYGVRPYVAHAWAGAVGTYAQVPAEQADPAVVAEARRLLLERLERNVCRVADRVRSFRGERAVARAGADREAAERTMLNRLRAEREALALVRGGGPVIWGVYVTGPPEAVTRLAADPLVAALEPVAVHVEERQTIVGVPRPPEPPPVGAVPAFPDVARLSAAQVRAQLDSLAAAPAPPCPTESAGTRLAPGHWTVVARHAGSAVLAEHPAAVGRAGDRRPQTEPTSLTVMIHSRDEPPRTATAALVPLQLPGVAAERTRPLRVGRVRIGGRDIYFTPPGWAPPLLPSPADPNVYAFGEADALWLFRPGQDVRRLTAERTGEYDRAQLATLQREGQVILYWASDPVWSPDGRTVAYVTNREAVARTAPGQAVWLLDLESRRERPLLSDPGESFSPIGWLGRELLFTGPPGVGAVDPRTEARRQVAFGLEIAVADDGSALAVADNVPHATRVQVLSGSGSQPVPAAPAGSSYAAQAVFSPGGGRLLLLATTPDGRLRRHFIFERATGALTPVSLPAGTPGDWPAWLDDDTLLVTTIDATTRASSSWVVDVGEATS
jgi:hypothetical protein